MEGRLCRCGKGKKWGALEEIPSVLNSPLVLGGDVNDGATSNNSYHTPPLASSSISPSSSSVIESDKENLCSGGMHSLLLGYQRNSVWVVNCKRRGVGDIGRRGWLIRVEHRQEGGIVGGDGGVVSCTELFKGS